MMSIVFFALSTLLLSFLAVLNARQVTRDRDAVDGKAELRIRYFANVEVRRAWMRASGWALFFAAMMVRLSMADIPERTLVVSSVILLGFGVFVVEALVGRGERKRMMRGEVEENAVSESLRRIEEYDEDRFSEKELEQREVRNRLDKADVVRREELEAVEEKLEEKLEDKLDEILRLLRRGR